VHGQEYEDEHVGRRMSTSGEREDEYEYEYEGAVERSVDRMTLGRNPNVTQDALRSGGLAVALLRFACDRRVHTLGCMRRLAPFSML